MLRLILIAGATYLLPLLALAYYQRDLIYPGARHHDPGIFQMSYPLPERSERLRTALGNSVWSLYAPADHARPNAPTLLFFYGNGSNIPDMAAALNPLRRRGINLLFVDYPGYGATLGRPTEAGCSASADAAYEYATTELRVKPSKLVIGGWSLGGAVAIDLASRKPAAGLVTVSTFSNMTDQAHDGYPMYPRFLLRAALLDKFDSDATIKDVRCPILIMHGREDDTISYLMSARLENAARSKVTRIVVPGAHHGDFFAVGGKLVYDEMAQFIAKAGEKNG